MRRIDRTGEHHLTKLGLSVVIINYVNESNCDVKFEDGTILKHRDYRNIKRGSIKNPNHPCVYGVGYFGQGVYKSNSTYYKVWLDMIRRCYDGKLLVYKDVTVCEEWHNFQNFAKWFEENPKSHIQKWHLDKDILIKGNKVYSPKTCAFVPQELNKLFLKNDASRGKYPIGVYKDGIRFKSAIVMRGRVTNLGRFNTPEEAFNTYKIAKEAYIKEVADKWKPLIEPRVYQAMYAYEVEITD